jgi:hypothetical protein
MNNINGKVMFIKVLFLQVLILICMVRPNILKRMTAHITSYSTKVPSLVSEWSWLDNFDNRTK